MIQKKSVDNYTNKIYRASKEGRGKICKSEIINSTYEIEKIRK